MSEKEQIAKSKIKAIMDDMKEGKKHRKPSYDDKISIDVIMLEKGDREQADEVRNNSEIPVISDSSITINTERRTKETKKKAKADEELGK